MMDMLLMIVKAFVVGGVLCAIGQVLILKTQLTSARILVGSEMCIRDRFSAPSRACPSPARHRRRICPGRH